MTNYVDHLRPWVDEKKEMNTVPDDNISVNVTPFIVDQDEVEPVTLSVNNETSDVPHIRHSQRQLDIYKDSILHAS